MGWPVSHYLVAGVVPQPMGDQNVTAAPSGTFHTADGPLNIAANQQHQYETLCHLVGRPDLLDDPRFADREQRKLHRDELNHELNDALRARTALEWENLLGGAGVPAARILTVPEATGLEQLEHRGFFTDVPFPDPALPSPTPPDQHWADGVTPTGARRLRVSSNGLLVDGERLSPAGAPPLLGEHNDEVVALVRRWSAGDRATREHARQPDVTR